VDETRVWRPRVDEADKRGDERTDGCDALREASRVQDHDAVVLSLAASIFAVQREVAVPATRGQMGSRRRRVFPIRRPYSPRP
jgi:hypothetical protein